MPIQQMLGELIDRVEIIPDRDAYRYFYLPDMGKLGRPGHDASTASSVRHRRGDRGRPLGRERPR
jgi:hypothetical protein